jgi:BirA family biotin operon repressor/biotin-[acetyl-CoA-carboxylase] ligase
VDGATRFTEVQWFAEIDSTNRYLVEQAHAGAPDGLVALADVQHAGKGRLGRVWSAPPGASLLVSVLVRPRLPRDHWPWLTGATGLAAVETVVSCCDLPARMKWPNDVVLVPPSQAPGKLAGILAEAAGDAVVIGMGLNIAWDEVPDELAGIATAVSLAGGRVVPRSVFLAEWLNRLERYMALLERSPHDGVAHLRRLATSRSATLGRRVRAELPDRAIEGTAVALDTNGALIVESDDGTSTIVGAGDVIHLR